MIRPVLGALLLATAVAAPVAARAQEAGRPARQAEDQRAFLEALQRTDPAAYEKFVALRDARDRLFAEVLRLQGQLQAAGPELRGLVLPQLRAARRRYAESAIALIDFLDERDRSTLREITTLLEQRQQARRELEKILREE